MLHFIANLPLAQDVAQDEVADVATRFGGSLGPDLTRYFVVCAILVVVIGLMAWGFKRLFSGDLKVRAAKRSLQTLDVLPMGGKRRIAVVRCYDRTFVLGIGDHEITPIAELDPVETADHAPVPAGKADDAAFAAALEAVRASMPNRKVAEVRKALPSPKRQATAPTAATAQAAPVKRKVRRKVRKSEVAPEAINRTRPKQVRQTKASTRSEVLSVAAAAQEIVKDKQRARTQGVAPAEPVLVQTAAPQQLQPVARPSTKAAAPKPPQVLRLEGVLG